MNLVFTTQGLGLRFLHRLADGLADARPVERRGFYVCDAEFHASYRREAPAFAREPHVLAEWDLLAEARHTAPETAYLRERERAWGSGPFWDALVCDRRIMQGRWCKERQDYRPRFSHDALLRILTVAVRRIDAWLDQVRPDAVLGLVPVSFGEYLVWMAARSRGVPTLYFYPTKIFNYMCWMDSFLGRPRVILDAYEDYRRTPRRDEWVVLAEQYLAQASAGSVRHEGMVPIPGTVAVQHTDRAGFLQRARRLAAAEWQFRRTPVGDDNHVVPPIQALVRRTAVAAWRRRRVSRHLATRYVRAPELPALDYAFYPLHAEPEVALSIQGRPYQNQIETIRNIARSLPVGRLLLTKEHPRSIGYHPPSYYDKLLEIPNVRVIDPFVESAHVIQQAALVVSVWSFVGFEAILQRKPLVSLGTPPFTVLPEGMVQRVAALHDLPAALARAEVDYAYDHAALVAYVAACLRASVPVDFYARYLEKRGRFGGEGAPESQFDTLMTYTVTRLEQALARPLPSA